MSGEEKKDISQFVAARLPDEILAYKPSDSHRLHGTISHPLLKVWNVESSLNKEHLLYPIFVLDVDGQKTEIKALPGQFRWSVDRLDELLGPLVEQGLSSVILFGVLTNDSEKDAKGSFAMDAKSPVVRALKYISANEKRIVNDTSISMLAEIAVKYAAAGAHVIAPSDMMDGRVGAIKHALRQHNLENKTAVMSYSAKYASCFYGPFREAAGSGMQFGDRSGYQLPPGSRGLGLRAIERDLDEGADFVMVKPGGPYLDMVRDCKNIAEKRGVPVAVYQVSGEYAMLYHAAMAGAFKLEDAVYESLLGMRRAGADIIITYFAPHMLPLLPSSQRVCKK